MDPVCKKLFLKAQSPIVVWQPPAEFAEHLAAMRAMTIVEKAPQKDKFYAFMLLFVRDCTELQKTITLCMPHLSEDAILWFAHPKKSSKKYTSDLNRDEGWTDLGTYGYEGVTGISIDEDWSGLRFRDVKYIKKMTRDAKRALSSAGKQRLSKKQPTDT
jgi:hypothetical protein